MRQFQKKAVKVYRSAPPWVLNTLSVTQTWLWGAEQTFPFAALSVFQFMYFAIPRSFSCNFGWILRKNIQAYYFNCHSKCCIFSESAWLRPLGINSLYIPKVIYPPSLLFVNQNRNSDANGWAADYVPKKQCKSLQALANKSSSYPTDDFVTIKKIGSNQRQDMEQRN